MSSPSEATAFAVALAGALRHAGVQVGIDRTSAFANSAACTGDLYWAGRLTLLGRREDIPVYDRVFRDTLLGVESVHNADEQIEQPATDLGAGQKVTEAADPEPEASAVERLRRTPFHLLTASELALLAHAAQMLRRRPPLVRTRRRRTESAGSVDLRRTVRDMERHAGEPMPPRFVAPTPRPQHLTFVIDVSGSMTTATRGLLVACALFVRGVRRHEAFTFGTRLTRVTPALRGGRLEDALDAAAALTDDRAAGTRIGDSLQALLDRHGQTHVVRGATVVVYSDGLERGDPEHLAAQMTRLGRLARRTVWLNPLSADPGYRPLARGMRAVLPHVDVFASGHDLETFELVVADTLERLG